jgi:hypothetical protein
MNELGLVPVTAIVREAIATRVAAEALRGGKLTHFSGVAEFPGFPRSLTKTLDDLRLNRADSGKLEEYGESGPDLAYLMTAYGRELEALRFADYASRVAIALRAVAAGKHPFTDRPVLLFDSYPATIAEIEFVEALMSRAPAKLNLRLLRDDTPVQNSLQSLQRYLLSESSDVPPNRPIDASFSLFSSSGEALECVEITRKILRAVGEGITFDEVGILLRSVERYQPLVAEALRRAGIPAHFTHGSRRPDPAGRSFLALLRCAQEGLSASRFAEYISFSQFPEGELPRSGRRWERFLSDAAVVGGKDRWERRLHGLAEELHREHGAAQDETDKDRIAARINDLDDFSGFALPLIQRLAALPARANWDGWLQQLHELSEVSLKDSETVEGLLDQLAPMSEIGPLDIDDVLRVLSNHLNTIRHNTDESRYGKVFVGNIEEARGLVFRTVFVPGVNEGMFPRPILEDPLLLDPQRKNLGFNVYLDDGDHLQAAVACASEQFVLSFSRLDLLTGR